MKFVYDPNVLPVSYKEKRKRRKYRSFLQSNLSHVCLVEPGVLVEILKGQAPHQTQQASKSEESMAT